MTRYGVVFCVLVVKSVVSWNYDSDNATLPSVRQLLHFKLEHPKPIGLFTVGSGDPVEIRDTISFNSDLFRNDYFLDQQSHIDGEIIPHRIVQAKGIAVWGHFEVTHDVSKYTKAEVFNGIGKKTPALVRYSVGAIGNGGTDLGRDIKDMSVKMYTQEGNLDLLNLHIPQFTIKDPTEFSGLVHAFIRKNPKTFLVDNNMLWDFINLRPICLTAFLYTFSDFGVPNGWRHADFFPIHAFELINELGERWYAKFNWRTEQGREYLTTQQIRQIADPDYFIRDMYNALENRTYPSWRLDMDILSLHDIQNVDFNPFDLTRLWKNGTYRTVTVGRLVLKRYSDNQFRDSEQAAFNPANLVPGIPGPVDTIFRARRFAYRDTQNYRLGRNHLKIGVNAPNYAKSYVRDGHPPVWDNGKDSPIYYPNSFNGPVPFVDDRRPKEYLQILETNAVDLQIATDFYYKILPDDASRQRLADNIVISLQTTLDNVREKAVKLLRLVSPDLARRVIVGLQALNLMSGYQIDIIKNYH